MGILSNVKAIVVALVVAGLVAGGLGLGWRLDHMTQVARREAAEARLEACITARDQCAAMVPSYQRTIDEVRTEIEARNIELEAEHGRRIALDAAIAASRAAVARAQGERDVARRETAGRPYPTDPLQAADELLMRALEIVGAPPEVIERMKTLVEARYAGR